MNDRVRIRKYKNIFSKGYTKKWSRKIFIIDLVLNTNPWTYKIKDLNWEKIIESFYEKELMQSILWMSHYPEPHSHIRDKVKVVLDLWNYATGKNWITLQALTHLRKLLKKMEKLKLGYLDVTKLKTVPVDLKKLGDVVDNEVLKNAKFNTLKTKVTA